MQMLRRTIWVLLATGLTAMGVYSAIRSGAQALAPELLSAVHAAPPALPCPVTGCMFTTCHVSAAEAARLTRKVNASRSATRSARIVSSFPSAPPTGGAGGLNTCPRSGCRSATCHGGVNPGALAGATLSQRFPGFRGYEFHYYNPNVRPRHHVDVGLWGISQAADAIFNRAYSVNRLPRMTRTITRRKGPDGPDYVVVWQEQTQGIPTFNSVRMTFTPDGQLKEYYAADADVTVSLAPEVSRTQAIAIVAASPGAKPSGSTDLRVVRDPGGAQYLVWQVGLLGRGKGPAFLMVDAHAGKIITGERPR
jgi:hypothetical protein